MAVEEWSCSQCTYQHKYPAQRCMMCCALRVSKQQMRDFVVGKSGSDDGGGSSNAGGSNHNVAVGAQHRPQMGSNNVSTRNYQHGGGENSRSTQNNPQQHYQSNVATTNNQNQPMANRGEAATATAVHHSAPANNVGGRPKSARPVAVSNPYSRQHQSPTGAVANNPYSKLQQSRGTSSENARPLSGNANNSGAGAMLSRSDELRTLNNDNNNRLQTTSTNATTLSGMQSDAAAASSSSSSRMHQGENSGPPRTPHNQNNQSLCIQNPYANRAQQHGPPQSSVARRSNPYANRAPNSPQSSVARGATRQHQQHNGMQQRHNHPSMQYQQQPQNHASSRSGISSGEAMVPNNNQQQQQRQQRPQQQHQHHQQRQSSSSIPAAATAANNPSSTMYRKGTLPSMGVGRGLYKAGPIPLCKSTRQNWIYPLDDKYPERIYQLEMSRAAIMQNTLVSLPTGLGKTLIAAVVMYNYYRWFPTGKVVFCAPTRPLVSQQIHACYKIMGIPEKHTAEISGRSKPESREAMWSNKRVFFCTPQTLVKDLQEHRCNAESIVCLVMDEAHRATGEHANAVLVRLLELTNAKYRFVGLSATPGKDKKSIQEVLNVLNISRIEARTEDDPNVSQYLFHREEEVIVVKQPDVINLLDKQFAGLMAPVLRRLGEVNGVASRLNDNNGNLNAWTVTTVAREYAIRTGDRQHSTQFNILRDLADSRQVLKAHGVQMARTKLGEFANKQYMNYFAKTPAFQALLRDMGIATGARQEDGVEGGTNSFENNPKLTKLTEVLVEHFERTHAINESTRVIVFSQWRESVDGIVKMLNAQNTSFLKPARFIGQARSGGNKGKKKGSLNASASMGHQVDAAGMNQAQQQRVLQQFSEGVYNVLVCTCVGEEGLDIGEVDLIVNFDVMKSAIRSIQRSGRTGRKRNGRVVFLVAESEERAYKESVKNTKTIAKALKDSSKFKLCDNKVGGHTPKTRRHDKGGTKKRNGQGKDQNKVKVIASNWRLDPAHEEERRNLFGDLPRSSCREYEKRSKEFPPSLKRTYLNSRSQSVYTKMLLKGKEPASIMSLGKSSTILKKLETSYCISNDDGAQEGRSSPINEVPRNVRDIMQNSVDLNSDDGGRSVDFGSDSLVGDQNNPDGTESLESNRICPDDPLDDIFGPIGEDARAVSVLQAFDPSQIAYLFDAARHNNCAVIAPPGMALDDSSDEESESVGDSAASTLSENEDLCAFFENDNSKDLAVEASRKTLHDQTMKTPFSDHGTDVDFGADDNIDFHMEGDDKADAESCNQVADATKCLESTLVIDGGNGKSADSPKWATGEEIFGLFTEKENINSQFPPSPTCDDNQSSNAITEKQTKHLQETNIEEENDGSCRDMSLEYVEGGTTDGRIETSIWLNDDSAECVDNNLPPQKQAQSPVVTSFRLPTPPPSSEESDDDCSDEGSGPQNSPPQHPNNDTSLDNAPKDEESQCGRFNDLIVESAVSEETGNSKAEVSFFQLPTQYSSSSEEEDDDDSAASNGPDHAGAKADNPLPPQTPIGEIDTVDATATSQNDQGSSKDQSSPGQQLADIESRHVQFKITSSAAVDLTDTPIKAPFSNSRMSLDSLTDTPLQPRQNVGRESLASLTDTPIQPRRNVGQQRKSLDSLADTPLQCGKNVGQQRKRLRTVPKNDVCKNQDPGTTEKLQRRKKRLEDKYRCRFLDCEAANDDSEDSDEENAEDEETSHDSFINDTSQLGYTQDDLDHVADEDIEVCDHGESVVLHRQVDHQHNVDNHFKTPVFNRRMRTPASLSQSGASQKGLGNMNFIRSVLEHHRQGGNADQLEEEYHQLARNNQSQHANDEPDFDSPMQTKQPSNGFSQTGNRRPPGSNLGSSISLQKMTSAGAVACDVPSAAPHNRSQPATLTSEQRAMVEAKRAEALKKRQQRMQQKATFNPYAK